MNTITRVILMVMLAFGSGCAKSDWIQQTLVTVDVTGTWRSTPAGGFFELALKQNGSTVKGSMRMLALSGQLLSGPIEGTVSGDTFSFRGLSVTGEMTASEDEMIGEVRSPATAYGPTSRTPFTLRRVSSTVPTNPQE